MKAMDLRGQRFGRLQAVSRAGSTKHGQARWLCRCDCGAETTVPQSNLKTGHTSSCGCLFLEKATTHGKSYSRTYYVWTAMIQRCTNPKSSSFEDYGARGISVDSSWTSFENFLADMGECPDDHFIDRIDNDGPYSKSNCRWATRAENNRNTRRSAATAERIEEIRTRLASGESPTSIANDTGIPRGRLYAIKHGRTWQ